MNRTARFLLLQKPNILAKRCNTSNNILDNIKDGVKQTIDAVNDTAQKISQTTVKISSQGIEIKNPAIQKMEHDDKKAPREGRQEIKHEKELKAASKTAHDIDEIDRLLSEKKNTF
uniref:Uncharacterized protein n=1 Tax=Panagrolaimus davidi TaxID=227884 RepID=A0A914QYX9_9BILA